MEIGHFSHQRKKKYPYMEKSCDNFQIRQKIVYKETSFNNDKKQVSTNNLLQHHILPSIRKTISKNFSSPFNFEKQIIFRSYQ